MKNLVLVCSAFRSLFTPFLYQMREYHLTRVLTKRPRYMSLPPHIDLTKALNLSLEDHYSAESRSNPMIDHKTNYHYARYLARLVRSTPNLESFSYVRSHLGTNSVSVTRELLGGTKMEVMDTTGSPSCGIETFWQHLDVRKV